MFSLYNMRENARDHQSVVVYCRAMHEYEDAVDSDSDNDDEADEDAQFGSFLHCSTTTPAFSEHESDWVDTEDEEDDDNDEATAEIDWEEVMLAGSVAERKE